MRYILPMIFSVIFLFNVCSAQEKPELTDGKEKESYSLGYHSVLKAKPAASKGRYVKSIALSSTMGPRGRVDLASVEAH